VEQSISLERTISLQSQCISEIEAKSDLSYLPIVCSGAVGIQHAALVVDISSVEQFVVTVSRLAAVSHVSSHCV
jgi:hypothetical protein